MLKVEGSNPRASFYFQDFFLRFWGFDLSNKNKFANACTKPGLSEFRDDVSEVIAKLGIYFMPELMDAQTAT